MEEINYRNAKLSDMDAIMTIDNSTISSRMVTADTELVSVESRLKWFEAHTPNKYPLWVVENEEGQIMG